MLETINKYKIILVPTWELAKTIKTPEATVEAEYGKHVLEGSLLTLAHHVEAYKNEPAPCVATVDILPQGSTIVVSHIDLDTIGGLRGAMGVNLEDDDFWEAAAYIDVNGPHHIHIFSEEVQCKLNAYWAWNSSFPRKQRVSSVTDVTDVVAAHMEVLNRILNNDVDLVAMGQKWAAETTQKVENCLIEEDEKIRIFATDEVFCSASYYSPNLRKIASATVVYNTKLGAITVATSDASFNCCDVMQKIFGNEAGGHAGIAGSPRGVRMTLGDFHKTVETVRSLLM